MFIANIVKCWKEFFVYFNALETQCGLQWGQILSLSPDPQFLFSRVFSRDIFVKIDVSPKRPESLRITLFLQSANYMHSSQSQRGQIVSKTARSTIFLFPFTKYFWKLEVIIIICRKIDVSPERNTLLQQSANYMHNTMGPKNLQNGQIYNYLFSQIRNTLLLVSVSQPTTCIAVTKEPKPSLIRQIYDFFIKCFLEILFLKFKLVSLFEGSEKIMRSYYKYNF